MNTQRKQTNPHDLVIFIESHRMKYTYHIACTFMVFNDAHYNSQKKVRITDTEKKKKRVDLMQTKTKREREKKETPLFFVCVKLNKHYFFSTSNAHLSRKFNQHFLFFFFSARFSLSLSLSTQRCCEEYSIRRKKLSTNQIDCIVWIRISTGKRLEQKCQRSLYSTLIQTNARTRMIQKKTTTRGNTVREREMKECVYAEACEGMLEDMPVTRRNSISVILFIFRNIGGGKQ